MTAINSCQENLVFDGPQLRIRLVALNARYVHSCLALFYIREELARFLPSATVELLQLTINDNPYESLLRVSADAPDAVLFSAAIWNSDLIVRLAEDLQASLPDCRIVVGGPEAGALRQRLNASGCTVVLGEVEAVARELCLDLAAGILKPCYRGSFLRLADKRLVSPYRDADFAGELLNRHVYFETSRGCPHSCTYCLSASEPGLFHKGLEQVRQELRQILRHRPKVVRFVDRTFNDVPERALAIWRFLAEEGGETLFHFEIAPDRFTEEMFGFLADLAPGRFQFEIGIQSTNPQTLAAIRRRMDIARVGPIICRLAALGNIHLHVDLILGLPFEDSIRFAESFRQVFAMGAHYIQLGLLKILPDTPICHGAADYGYLHSTHPPYPVLANAWLSHHEMGELYWFCEVVEKVHNNRYFVTVWRYLRRVGDDMFIFFRDLLAAGKRVGFPHRAVTQELLCGLLVEVCRTRSDWPLLLELLRYDWLRCGFRQLPEILAHQAGEESPEMTRDLLFHLLPSELEGVYSPHGRNQFFKRSVFLRLGREAANMAEVTDFPGEVRLAVMADKENSLFQYQRLHVVPIIPDGQTG